MDGKALREMADETPLESTILEKAARAKSVSVDGTTTSQRDVSELIEADKYLANKAARAGGKLPIRVMRIRPGGAA